MPPEPGTDAGAAPADRPATLTQWLRARTDAQLARLLRLRPDLALPAPPDIVALAGRVGVRTSTQRAVDELDAAILDALEQLVLGAHPDDTAAGRDVQACGAALDALLDRALVWGDGDRVRLTPTVRDAVGPYPAGLGRPAAVLFSYVPDLSLVPVLRSLGLPAMAQPRAGAAVAAQLAEADTVARLIEQSTADERDVLRRLAGGPPIGSVRTVRPAAADDAGPAQRLIARGLLVPIDLQRVELPREVGVQLRAHGAPPERGAPPEVALVRREPAELDSLGTTAVREAIRLVDALAESWTAAPPAVLRAGGLGVRDLRRTARDLGVDEPSAAVIAEVAFSACLLNSTNSQQPVFLPSVEYDSWRTRDTAAQWMALASAWLTMTRQPSLAGQRGERDRVISALGPDAERGTIAALRRHVLNALIALPPGSTPAERADVLAVLAWQQPRRAAGQRPVIEAILREADLLGVTAAGGITGYTRTLLAGSAAAAQGALTSALPAPVDHFLVQPDLTIVVPGPPAQALGDELALLADVESTGGASVYRISERSVRRALDAGRTGEQLLAFVTSRSQTPVPQALQYLIEDSARRHGTLRAGAVSAYLRCDDPALLARVVADRAAGPLGLRLIAPTVAVAAGPVVQLLGVLRDAGYAPAAEGTAGELVTIGAERPRSPARPAARPLVHRPSVESDTHVAELVRRLRAGEAAGDRLRQMQSAVGEVPGVNSATVMDQLRTAVREGRTVWLGVAEPDGRDGVHELQPISLAAGYVRGYERGRGGLASYPVHRITAVRPATGSGEDGFAEDGFAEDGFAEDGPDEQDGPDDGFAQDDGG